MSAAEHKALYCVGYAHLDTQWRWDFVTTIDDYIRATLDDNFALIEKYPDYTFNFTGSVRYEMMKEYYPERYERLKRYIADGRWFVSGSSVDEGDVNVPSAESIIRQVLYGNLSFRREFGKESVDFMLPDCFGFPASMPSIWAHCGLLGFSTQKLTWGSAVGIPFKVGVWEGPDGNGVIAALDPGPYVGAIEGRVDRDPAWRERVDRNGQMYGLWADYHYYGTGDQGGAPTEEAVQNYTSSKLAADREMEIVLGSSDQLYRDIPPELRARLPRYRGDMLLTEHSSGTLTSQSTMKRWNRQAEQLADAAERAATIGWWLGVMEYPREKLERAWVRILANQMHDILPGTSIPRAYRYSWNDDVVGLNLFAGVLTHAVGRVSAMLDTEVVGSPLVVFNPLAIERSDVVEARFSHGGAIAVRVFDGDGAEVPSQILERDAADVRILFSATVPANGFAVYDVRPADAPFDDGGGPLATSRVIENESYRVTMDDAGDVASIWDVRADREMLSGPASLVFTQEKPRNWPAWNMDWADRQQPPVGKVDGAARWRIVENGPVRAALAVTRWARNSEVTQVVRLSRGEAGRVVEVAATIDWQSTGCALKASFPLAVSNSEATYNWGVGTISRGNNEPTKYEVPSHEWFDLTDAGGDYGVTVVEDSKFGSDKPADNELRLTLLYTPGVRGSYMDQHSQDWGVHEIRYGLYGHANDWRVGGSEWQGRRFNQPLRAFRVGKHGGALGRRFSFVGGGTRQVDVRAIKRAEESDVVIVRVQELWGREAKRVSLRFPAAIAELSEVDGQERELRKWDAAGNEVTIDLAPFGMRSFALRLGAPAISRDGPGASTPIELPFDTIVATRDEDRGAGAMDAAGRSYPAELLPVEVTDDGITFRLATADGRSANAVTCRGQRIPLGDAAGNEIHVLAAATEDARAAFLIGDKSHVLGVQSWTGFVGQWYDRVWDREFGEVDHTCDGRVRAILPGFIKRDAIAWFSTHRHDAAVGNEAYQFAYLYHYVLLRRAGEGAIHQAQSTDVLTLPYDERIRVFAVSTADGGRAKPAEALYDELSGGSPIAIRHDYDAPIDAVFTGQTPLAEVRMDRERRYELLEMGPPRSDDDVDASRSKGFAFRHFDADGRLRVHRGSGAVEGVLVRLNDGQAAENDDDTDRCIWFDNEGRFTLDLHEARRISRMNAYSWHRSNRAVQYYSIWGSAADAMPDPGFRKGESAGWELIAVVDTRSLGEGDIHGACVTRTDGALGPYRHLLWVAEDVGQGTFFTEIDVDVAGDGP